MQYNFESVCEDFIIKFDKKLDANMKAIMSNMAMIFDLLSDKLPFDQRKQLEQVVTDILSDGNKSLGAVFHQTMLKTIKALKEVIHE